MPMRNDQLRDQAAPSLERCLAGARLWAEIAAAVQQEIGCSSAAAEDVSARFLRSLDAQQRRTSDEPFQRLLDGLQAPAPMQESGDGR
jgi:hypothetical protein